MRLVARLALIAALAVSLPACGGDDDGGTKPPDGPVVLLDVKDGTWQTVVTTRTVILVDDDFCASLFEDLVPDPFEPVDETEQESTTEVLCEITEDDLPIGSLDGLSGCTVVEGTDILIDCTLTIPGGACPLVARITGSGTLTETSTNITARLELRSDPVETCGGLLCFTEITGVGTWISDEGTCPTATGEARSNRLARTLDNLITLANR